MRCSMLIPAVMAIVFGGAAVPAMSQIQLALLPSTVTGILVDASCYTTRGKTAMGPGTHEKCAIVCAQKGNRLALVTAKGDVYRVIGTLTQMNNARLVPLVNKTVVITGTIQSVVIQKIVTGVVQTVVTNLDNRRPAGTEDGVTPPLKTGDARQGDVLTAPEIVIDATAIDLAKVP